MRSFIDSYLQAVGACGQSPGPGEQIPRCWRAGGVAAAGGSPAPQPWGGPTLW